MSRDTCICNLREKMMEVSTLECCAETQEASVEPRNEEVTQKMSKPKRCREGIARSYCESIVKVYVMLHHCDASHLSSHSILHGW